MAGLGKLVAGSYSGPVPTVAKMFTRVAAGAAAPQQTPRARTHTSNRIEQWLLGSQPSARRQ
jgi:hypothetical protein